MVHCCDCTLTMKTLNQELSSILDIEEIVGYLIHTFMGKETP